MCSHFSGKSAVELGNAAMSMMEPVNLGMDRIETVEFAIEVRRQVARSWSVGLPHQFRQITVQRSPGPTALCNYAGRSRSIGRLLPLRPGPDRIGRMGPAASSPASPGER